MRITTLICAIGAASALAGGAAPSQRITGTVVSVRQGMAIAVENEATDPGGVTLALTRTTRYDDDAAVRPWTPTPSGLGASHGVVQRRGGTPARPVDPATARQSTDRTVLDRQHIGRTRPAPRPSPARRPPRWAPV
jgi:hypothetical protein